MPRYDFRCSSCGEVFEDSVPMSQRESKCSCGGVGNRLISAPWQKIDINSDRWVNRNKKRRKT